MMPSDPGEGAPPVILNSADGTGPASARWRWYVHLVVLGAFPLVIGALSLLGDARSGPALSSTVRGVLSVSIVELGLFAVIFGFAWAASRVTLEQLYLARPFRWIMLPASVAYSIGLRVAIAVVAAMIAAALVVFRVISFDQISQFVGTNRPDLEALVDLNALENNPMYLFLNATLVSFVVAGFREELWRAGFLAGLRHLWPRQFGGFKGQVAGVAIAAVIFGLGHTMQGALAVFLTGVLGFFLGLIMLLHKSLWPAVLAHGFFNATTFIILPWFLKHLPELGLMR